MIEHLFISKVRVKLLHLFFSDLSREIHIRGIVRKIDEEINAVRRELKNLEEIDILQSEKRGNRLYYKINPRCPVSDEITGLIHKEFGLGGIVLRNTDTLGSVLYAVLTTAFIQNHHPSSYDIDLIMIGDINLKSLSSLVKKAEEEMKREIRYTVMDEEEFTFRKKKRDAFVMNILEKSKIMLIGDENRLLA